MPRVVVSNEVGDRNIAITQVCERTEKPGIALGNEVSVFYVMFKNVSQQNQGLDTRFEMVDAINKSAFFLTFFGDGAFT